ncbi:MAG: hypothetical protein IKK88_00095, partial [Oscillospiraceae bacterium]|nr:hypothetical protein [Oscillospiraceae bacterium]
DSKYPDFYRFSREALHISEYITDYINSILHGYPEIQKYAQLSKFLRKISSAAMILESAYSTALEHPTSDVAEQHAAKVKKYLDKLEQLSNTEVPAENVDSFISESEPLLTKITEYAEQIEQECYKFSDTYFELKDNFEDHKEILRDCLQNINELIPQINMAENFTIDGRYVFKEYIKTALKFKELLLNCITENFRIKTAEHRIKVFDNLYCRADSFRHHIKDKLKEVSATHSGLFKDKCKVRIYFPSTKTDGDYYNDTFRLAIGDVVTVRNNGAVQKGIVTDINIDFWYDFSEPDRVLAVDESHPLGKFYLIDERRITFDSNALSFDNIKKYFDFQDSREIILKESELNISDLENIPLRKNIFERGTEYFQSGKVDYLCLDGTHSVAVIGGSNPYILKFEYSGGDITHFTCNCPCDYMCKHQVAVVLQLREILEFIAEYYPDKYNGYFAMVDGWILRKHFESMKNL